MPLIEKRWPSCVTSPDTSTRLSGSSSRRSGGRPIICAREPMKVAGDVDVALMRPRSGSSVERCPVHPSNARWPPGRSAWTLTGGPDADPVRMPMPIRVGTPLMMAVPRRFTRSWRAPIVATKSTACASSGWSTSPMAWRRRPFRTSTVSRVTSRPVASASLPDSSAGNHQFGRPSASGSIASRGSSRTMLEISMRPLISAFRDSRMVSRRTSSMLRVAAPGALAIRTSPTHRAGHGRNSTESGPSSDTVRPVAEVKAKPSFGFRSCQSIAFGIATSTATTARTIATVQLTILVISRA